MFKKIVCKFPPGCIDGDECFFEHSDPRPYNYEPSKNNYFCTNGEQCLDQSCQFSEAKHMKPNSSCRFQENCNRLSCVFKHNVERKAFLGEGSLNKKGK